MMAEERRQEEIDRLLNALLGAIEDSDSPGMQLSPREVQRLIQDIAHLREVVLEGNGKPSLRETVAVISANQDVLRQEVRRIDARASSIDRKVDAIPEEFRKHVNIAVVVLGIVVTIVSLFGDKLLG